MMVSIAEARVLLVTLFSDERTIYAEALRQRGWDVYEANGPDDAFAEAVRKRPSVIITRFQQPGHDTNGLDLLRRVRNHHATACIPVIVITSLIQPELRVEAEEAGCDGYLLLPTLPDAVIREVERVLSHTKTKTA